MITLVEKWKKSLDNCGTFGALFTDLYEVCNCLSHELLNAKLDVYGFYKNASKLVNSYLTYGMQIAKINDKYSSWSEIFFGVPQHSILGHLLFNVFIRVMFYFLKDFYNANYADDSTPYNEEKNIEIVVNNLEQLSSILFKWLNDNNIKVNTDKSHFLVSRNIRTTSKIDSNYIESEKE